MKKTLMFPFTLLALLFGKISWMAPPWLRGISHYLKSYPKIGAILFGALIIAEIAYHYFDSLPRPVMVRAEFDALQVTPNYEGAKSDSLNIRFYYDLSSLNDNQAIPEGDPSVARLDLLGQEIKQGISLSPPLKGVWTWIDDRSIQFTAEKDWPAGTEFSVKFDNSLFVEEARLSEDSYSFKTPELKAEFDQIELYQDPQDISVRRVVSTLKFSHPVDATSLQKSLSMQMRPSGSNVSSPPKPYSFTVTYDKNYREAYVQSEPVQLPPETNYMQLTLQKGVKSLLGGETSQEPVEAKTSIPDIYSFLKVNSVKANIVRNEKNEPQQLLMLEFTDDIDQQELLGKLSVYLLPKKGQRNGRNYWKGPRQVNANVISDSAKVTLRLIPNERNFSKSYNFIVDVAENRYLYLKIDKGLTSVNKFVHSSFYDSVQRSPNYPKEVDISGDGSLLTFSGEHKLSVLTRGVPALKYSVGRVFNDQLNHLVSQTSGDLTSPRFNNWSFNEANIAEFDARIIPLEDLHPRRANYSSFDLSEYLAKEKNNFGLFFVDVKAWDNKRNRIIHGAGDTRLILVTNLGVIVKNNADQSHEVFVQSITDGEPVKDARVELLGKNGIVIAERTTDEKGHASFPSTKGFKAERMPTVYIVKTEKDMSFIPFERSSRQINLSKFDIGGVQSSRFRRDSLNAFLFSDRGIYRPGEEINIGLIVKHVDLSNVENIPLEIVVKGPRNKELKVKRFTLPEKGFTDFQFPTEAESDTGRYSVAVHLIRDRKYRGRLIGSTEFKVEEFQPDSMKIESRLVDVVDSGWNTQSSITSKVSLMNLFGTPAQDRKMTGQVIIRPASFSFKKFKDYQFTDPNIDNNRQPLSLNEMLAEKRTDADGIASFDIDLEKFRGGTYKLQFIAQGFDQAGGRSVVASNSALISPLEAIIGYKADGKLDYINANSARNIHFIAIDKMLDQKQVQDLTLKLIDIQQISTLVKQNNGTYKYQTINKEVEVSTEQLSISQGGFDFSVDSKVPGDYAIEIFDAKKRRLSRLQYSVVGFANLAGKLDKNAELQLKLDKQDYFPGDSIEMSIKAPYSGAGLITIETDRVHQFKWFKTQQESTVQHIQLPENLEGTAYINVAFVRDVGSKEIFTSPLSYAVQPFSIDKSKRRIDVVLKTKDIVRPGKPMDISFSTSRASKIVLFAVDEGILQVAKYSTPDPLGHFLKKRSLDVETLQILDLILPDFNLVKDLSAVGGGDSERKKALSKNLNPFSRKTDKPAVFWSGIYDATNEPESINFNVPNTFSGELRVMAVAVGAESVGASSTSSIVRGPFVISPNVLTQAAPGDEFLVTVGIANIIEGSGKNAPVDLTLSSSEHLQILGEQSTALSIDEGSEGKFTFRVKAKSRPGAAQLTFTAKHRDEELSRSASLSVRPATTYYSRIETGFEKDGALEITPARKLIPDLAQQSVAASASPLVIVDGLTSYLETFPHGCTEQVVSKVFPLVGLMTHPAYASHLPHVKSHFSRLIDKLRERQLGDGGFSFWPGHQSSAEYPSIYVMHFLLESSELGYPVPTDMMQRGKDYLKFYVERAATSLSAARDRANAIYLLTRMGVVTTNYLVDLEENLGKNHQESWKKDILSSYMAATYKLLQKDSEAEHLISSYQLDNNELVERDDFHSTLATDAQYIYLLAKHFQQRAKELEGEVIHQLSEKIFRGEYNTLSSAYSILALGAYSQLVLGNDFNEVIEFSATDDTKHKNKLKASLQPFMKALYAVGTKGLEIEGKESLYYLNVQTGFDSELPQKAIREGLEIYRDFVDDKGNVVNTFKQGRELTVRLKVRALDGRALQNIAVIDLLPGGFEVIRSSVSRTAYNWRADYVDVREDRVVYYGKFDSNIRELTYRVKLTSAGEFVIPPSYAESMYDRSIRAVSEAGKFIVTASQ